MIIKNLLNNQNNQNKNLEILNSIINKFEEWLIDNRWLDGPGYESYQVEKPTFYYDVLKKFRSIKGECYGTIKQ